MAVQEPINRILKMLRIAEDMSARELAGQIGLSPSYISDIETGRKKPTLTVLEKYGQLFGISPANLLLLQEGNQRASHTELLFKVLEKKLEAMESHAAAVKTVGSVPQASPSAGKAKKPPKTLKQGQKGLAAAV
ncbi:MAG: helix-turn-helix domain-containing protein [Coriobacteriaceae bacterium]|jgi:transcriptional regulator with XRE-family HTH domain|nr:helix-turn-helix domain-containing protein [Coriobacteriaceae bacterium]